MPSVHSDLLAKTRKDKDRRRVLERCKNDLWFLASEVLGYKWNPKAGRYGKGLTEEFHKPICDWLQMHRDKSFVGMWFARFHHKTTIDIAQMVQDWLVDPSACLLYWHAVDDRASEVVIECVTHIKTNKRLRALDPVGEYPLDHHDKDLRGQPIKIFPAPNAKRFQNTTGFTLCKTSINDGLDRRPQPSRFQSLLARGAGSETTGAHGNKAYLDDPIGRNDIEDGQLPKKAAWFQNTVLPVVDDMVIRASGTPWGDWGMYRDWKESPDWYTLFIPGSTADAYVEDRLDLAQAVDWTQKKIDLSPDYSLDHPVYGTRADRKKMKTRLTVLQRQMKSDFPPQIMVDESPEGERPWNQSACETFIGIKARDGFPGAAGPGTVWVLSDPAPVTVGAGDETKQKSRGDGTKDKWAISVWKCRHRGDRRESILIDGSASRQWTTDQGMDEACRLMTKWRTNKCIHETYGGLQKYDEPMARAVIRNGTKWMRWDTSGGNKKQIQFYNSYGKGAKNKRIADFAAMAAEGEVFICETVPDVFLYGESDQRHTGLLPQARAFRPLQNGRNSLSYDDELDSCSRVTDPVVWKYVTESMTEDQKMDPFARDDSDDAWSRRSRYCAV